jgi:squalene-hopene/tetraprenyl-beta-curcumene cyclase
LRKRYGRDKTFAVPILANAALAGQVPWNEVSRLPFELACLPQSWYRFLQLPVVSYAIPALVAVGQAIHHARKPANPLTRWLRTVAIEPSLRVLGRIQPASGGYLEAVPLTSFVAMSLASCGRAEHPVTKKCIEFIKNSMRADASWPIDTNLATWNTTLALNALGGAAGKTGLAPGEHTAAIEWVLSCQNTAPHPFTGAAPGGWGWSDLSGAVPDADDTPGALLALRSYCDLPERDAAVAQAAGVAATHGVRWLLDLQNRDGGWPTFCRGWGKLPFDRSGTDLTAHALRALHVWRQVLPQEIDLAAERGWSYLARYQNADGSWTPLWFGNQYHPQEENPIYGTSKCLLAYRDCARMKTQPAQTALDWLIGEQNDDGGWGGDGSASSMEETSLATEAVIAAAAESMRSEIAESAWSGVNWLISAIECDQHRRASPIGLYFAKLWYYESTYPLAFTASALRAAKSSLLPLDAERCVRNQSDATHSQARGCEFGNR